MVAFAAESGTEAYSGQGLNSLFTAALLDNIATHGHVADVRDLLQVHVRASLQAATEHQMPWVTSSLGPTPRCLVCLGASLRMSESMDVSVGAIVQPLVALFQEQVRLMHCSER